MNHPVLLSLIIITSNVVNGHSISFDNRTDASKREAATDFVKVFTKNDIRENMKYFADIMGKMINKALEETPVVGKLYTSITELIYEFSKKKKQDLFSQVEAAVGTKISEEITKYHFDSIVGTKMYINAILKEKKLTKSQWFTIKAYKYKFLPQLYRSIKYTKDFYPELIAYGIIFAGATADMIHAGQLSPCRIVKELKALKQEVEHAVESLILKRYSMFTGTGYEAGNLKRNYLKFKDLYTNKALCQNEEECYVYKKWFSSCEIQVK